MKNYSTSSVNKSVAAALRKRSYTSIKPLGEGSYGVVLSAQTAEKERVAVKVIDDHYSWKVEEKVWPLLKHENILPVLAVFTMPKLEKKMYISPLHPNALDLVVESEAFLGDSGGLDRIRRWFREILCGLNYLHSAGYAHMDVKSDNVLITACDSAVLCDFSGLNFTSRKIRRICAPKEYCPPECWLSKSKAVEGVSFDMWSFGIMSLGVLTSHWPQKNIFAKRKWTWDDDLWPRLAHIIREPTFSKLVRTALPSVTISKVELRTAKHFVMSFMHNIPEQRLRALAAERHPFLLRNTKRRREVGDEPVYTARHSTCSAYYMKNDDVTSTKSSRLPRIPREERRRAEKRPFSSESRSDTTYKKVKCKKENPKLKKRKRADSEEVVKSQRGRLKK